MFVFLRSIALLLKDTERQFMSLKAFVYAQLWFQTVKKKSDTRSVTYYTLAKSKFKNYSPV